MTGPSLKVPKVAGANISGTVRELQDLHETMSKIDQGEFDNHQAQLVVVASKLIERDFLRHSDKTVRLLVSCCLADILRLFAPDAPYNRNQLNSIFTLFIQQIKMLADTKNIYYHYLVYLVESLATIKSIVLLLDIEDEGDGTNELLLQAFNLTFDLASVPTIVDTIKLYLREMLQVLIDELDTIPSELIICLLTRICDNHSMTRAMVEQIVRACATKIQGPLGLFFNETLTKYIAEGGKGKAQFMEGLRKLHRQVVDLGKICPEVISSVLSQIEDELQADDQELRILAVSTLPTIFCAPNCDAYRLYPTTWNSWINKINDKAVQVRLAWVKAASQGMIRAPLMLSHQLQGCLVEKLQDIDAKLREKAMNYLEEAISVAKSQCYLSPELCKEITARCRDKAEDVRMQAIKLLCLIIRQLFVCLPEQHSVFDICVNGIFHLLFVTDRDLRLFYEYYIEHSLMIPKEEQSAQDHARFIIALYHSLSEDSRKAFLKWLHNKSLFVRYLEALLSVFSKNSKDSRLDAVIQFLSSLFRDPVDAQACLRALIESILPNSAFLESFKFVVLPTAPIIRLRKKIGDLENYSFSSVDARIKHYIVTYLVRRGSFLSINADLINSIIEVVEEQHDLHSSAQRLISEIISEFPALGLCHAHILEELIAKESGERRLEALRRYGILVKSVGNNLKPSAVTIAEIWNLLERGNRKEVKYCTRILQYFSDQETHLMEHAETCFRRLIDGKIVMTSQKQGKGKEQTQAQGQEEVRYWQILVEVARKISFVGNVNFTDAFEYVKSCIKSRIMVNCPSEGKGSLALELDKNSSLEISICLGIKFLRNFLATLRIVDRSAEISQLKTFAPVLVEWLSTAEKSMIIKFTIMKTLIMLVPRPGAMTLADNLMPLIRQWRQSPTSVQDRLTSFVVRKYHMAEIGLTYLAFPILCNEKPTVNLVNILTSVKSNDRFVQNQELHYQVNSRNIYRYEPWLILIAIVAIATNRYEIINEEALRWYGEIANFLVNLVADAHNISWLFEAAVQLKRMTFIEQLRGRTRHLYVLSDLLQNCLRQKANQHRWALESNKYSVLIVDDILENIMPVEEANLNAQKSYLDHYRSKTAARRVAAQPTTEKMPLKLDSSLDGEFISELDKENRPIRTKSSSISSSPISVKGRGILKKGR